MAETYVLQDKEEMRKVLENANNSRSMQKELLSKETSERWRILYCNSLKNHMAHACVDGLLALLTDSSESEKLKPVYWRLLLGSLILIGSLTSFGYAIN